MFGYMTKREALRLGFTHHGRYFGIPCWIAEDGPGLKVSAKWAPMAYLMTVFHHIEGAMRSVMFPNDEPVFQFQIGPAIADGVGGG